MAQIKKFGVLQTAKFAAVMYFILTAIVMIPLGLIGMVMSSVGGGREGLVGALFGGVFIFMAPIIYAVLGFIFVGLTCLVYNLVAQYVGGIEIEIEP